MTQAQIESDVAIHWQFLDEKDDPGWRARRILPRIDTKFSILEKHGGSPFEAVGIVLRKNHFGWIWRNSEASLNTMFYLVNRA